MVTSAGPLRLAAASAVTVCLLHVASGPLLHEFQPVRLNMNFEVCPAFTEYEAVAIANSGVRALGLASELISHRCWTVSSTRSLCVEVMGRPPQHFESTVFSSIWRFTIMSVM